MTATPTERDLSYRDAQRAAANATRGTWSHPTGRVPPGQMPRRIRLGLRAIVHGAGSAGEQCKAAARLLGTNVVDARSFLNRLDVTLLVRKAKPRVVAFNHTPGETRGEDGTITINRPFRNAAKAQRQKPAPRGPAKQPRTPRSARYQRRHGVSP